MPGRSGDFYRRIVNQPDARETDSGDDLVTRAQDIVTRDWARIARMTRRIEEVVHLDVSAPARTS